MANWLELLDSALLELFESERKERGFSVSRMLDVVIWNYFSIGKTEPPKLSFELSEGSQSGRRVASTRDSICLRP